MKEQKEMGGRGEERMRGKVEGGGRREKRESMKMSHVPADSTVCVIHEDSQRKCCIQNKNRSLSRSEQTNRRIVQTLSKQV